jgi:hypothetical protein
VGDRLVRGVEDDRRDGVTLLDGGIKFQGA